MRELRQVGYRGRRSRSEVGLIFKALVCSALVFIAVGALGIWLQRLRGPR